MNLSPFNAAVFDGARRAFGPGDGRLVPTRLLSAVAPIGPDPGGAASVVLGAHDGFASSIDPDPASTLIAEL